MNLRALTRKYLGWCPGVEAATNFNTQELPSRESFYQILYSTLAVIVIIGGVIAYTRYLDPIVHLAHYEDPIGDSVIPHIDPAGNAPGGAEYLGADILNVTLDSPTGSDKLMITVVLNGLGKADPTIDKNITRLNLEFRGSIYGHITLYYNGDYGSGIYRGNEQDIQNVTYEWVNNNTVKFTIEELPHTVLHTEISIATQRWYRDAAETPYRTRLVQCLDKLVYDDYVISGGGSKTITDATNQLYPLLNASMPGVDIQSVDVYRRGNILNVTVTLYKPELNCVSIPSTFRDYRDRTAPRIDVSIHSMDEMHWHNIATCISDDWIVPWESYYMTFDIVSLRGIDNVDVIRVETTAQFFPTISGEIVDGGHSMWWYFDVVSVPFNNASLAGESG